MDRSRRSAGLMEQALAGFHFHGVAIAAALAIGVLLAACVTATPTSLPASTAPSSPPATPMPAAAATATPTPTATAATTTASTPTPAVDQPVGQLSGATAAQLELFGQSLVTGPGGAGPTTPGLVLLVDTPEGRFLQAFGVADLTEGTPLQVADRFEVGSITKTFMAVLLLQLQEEGMLDLDDPLSRWLPDMAALLPNGQAMTLRQLAQHRAGLADYERDLVTIPFRQGDRQVLRQAYSPEEVVGWVAQHQEPLFVPGDEGRWGYSSTGYLLLGMVLERATGRSLAELLQGRIFDPLGMASAVYLQGSPAPGQVVRGYSPVQGQMVDVTDWDAAWAGAAGALAMNASDLARFAQALASGTLFQDPAALGEMLDFQTVPAQEAPGISGYGLGVIDYGGGTWGHSGGTPGFVSLMAVDPESATRLVILSNSTAVRLAPDLLQGVLAGP